ncbi:MAG: SRPBCC family protein [Bacteroidota bacterium]
MLQIILIVVASIIGIILLLAAIMKKEYALTCEIIINRTKNDVFNYVKHLKNQEKYSVWVMRDPNIKLVYTGTDGTIGFKAAWSSEDKNVGVGEQEITNIKEGERYDVEIRFEKPFKGISYANTSTTAVSDNQTKVVTTFTSRTPFPMNIMVPMLTKMLLKDMNENANNLKANLETK